MRDVESINREIDELKSRMSTVEGTPTEIYTRIVGYYRSLSNWNRGKREEYGKRRTFDYGEGRGGSEPHETAGEAPSREPVEAAVDRERVEAEPAGAEPAPATAFEPRRSVAVADRPERAEEEPVVAGYAYFFRPTCPNCPPVRTLLEASELGGNHFDVDTDDGFAMAAEMQILATPTVVFFDGRGEPVGRANAPKDVQRYLSFAE